MSRDPAGTALRGALIGCGFVAGHHLDGWRRQSGAKLAALCDLDPARLKAASAHFPDTALHHDAAALFATERLDFVEICTRPESHRPLVELAARHGVNVLCQKPVALNRAELVAMIDACDRAGVRFMVHENWRFRPWNRALRAALDRGTIDRPIRLRIAHRDPRALLPDGFATQPYFSSMTRLILFEMGCHLVDTARYLMGEIDSVTATIGRFGSGHPGEDVATLLVRFTSGALGLLDMTWCAPDLPETARSAWALNETVLEGASGMLRLRTDGSIEIVALDGRACTLPVDLPADDLVYRDGYRLTQAHFVEGLRKGTPHETSGTDTLRTMDVVWTAYHAATTGRTLRVGDLA